MPATCSTKKTWRQRLKKIGWDFVMPGGSLARRSKEAYAISVMARGRKMSNMVRIKLALAKLDASFAESNGGYDKVTPQQRDALNRFLGGEQEAILDLPESVQKQATNLRGMVDGLTISLIEQGQIDEGLVAVFQENTGVYLTRAFRAHAESDWAQVVKDAEAAGDTEVVSAMNQLRSVEKRRLVTIEARRAAEKEYKEKYGVQVVTMPMKKGSKWKAIFRKHRAAMEKAIDPYGQSVNERVDAFLGLYSGDPKSKKANALKRDLGILKKRRTLKDWERVLLGEYDSPEARWVNTIVKQSDLLMVTDLLLTMRETLGPDVLMSPERALSESMEGGVRISKDENPAFAPLDGYVIDEEIYDMIRYHFGANEDIGTLHKIALKSNAVVKFGLLVLSIPTQIRNLSSASLFPVSNGFLPGGFKKSARVASQLGFKDLSKSRSKLKNIIGSDKEFWVTAKPDDAITFGGIETTVENVLIGLSERGVLNESARAGDLGRLLALSEESEIRKLYETSSGFDGKGVAGKVVSAAKSTADKASAVYQGSDNIFKIMSADLEMRSLAKQYPDKAGDIEWLMDQAAPIVRKTTPTYSEVSPGVRKWGVLNIIAAPFPSFSFEAMRNGVEIARQGFAEVVEGVSQGNAARTRRGAARLTGLSLVTTNSVMVQLTKAYLWVLAYNTIRGGDEPPEKMWDEWEYNSALRRLGPDYYKNSDLVVLGRNPNNRDEILYTNLSFFNIHSVQADAIKNLNRTAFGRDWEQNTKEYTPDDYARDVVGATFESIFGLLSPFVSKEVAVPAILEAFNNSNGRGGTLYNEEVDSAAEIMEKQLDHIFSSAMPTTIKQIRRMVEANKKDDKAQFEREMSALFGFRISKLNRSFAGKGAYNRYQAIRASATSELKRYLTEEAGLEEEDIVNKTQETNREYLRAQQELDQDVLAISYMFDYGDVGQTLEYMIDDKIISSNLAQTVEDGYFRGVDTQSLLKDTDDIRARDLGYMRMYLQNKEIFQSLDFETEIETPPEYMATFPD